MRLSCPACDAAYDLPETLFLTGARKVRCVKCGHAWMAGERAPATPEEPPPAAVAPPPAEPGPEAEAEEAPARRPLPLRRRAAPPPAEPPPLPDLLLAPPPEPRGSGRPLAVAWAASVLLLAVACWAGWEYRGQVVAAWPASARLYTALGGMPGG